MSKPRLFIASSRESLALAEVLASGLAGSADVVVWNDVFESQQTYLESLLRIPETYDFGVFVLGPDDSVVSRGKAQTAPRDNVVFEMGLFMQALGLERTFPVVPKDVKVCSDIAGWKLFEYDEPRIWSEFRGKIAKADTPDERKALHEYYRKQLEPAVQTILGAIARKIQQLGPKSDISVHAVAEGVHDIWPSIKDLVTHASALPGPVLIRHLALDMADAWDLLRGGIVSNGNIRDIKWRCLMLDPDSPDIVEADSPSVSRDAARQAMAKIEQTLSQKKIAQQLKSRGLEFECKAYRELPRMHGFSIEDHALLLSMCDIDQDGKLDAASTPYFRFDAKAAAHSHHVITCFENWFDYRWSRASRQVWPPPEKA